MTYIAPTSSGSSGYTGKEYAIYSAIPRTPNYENWRLQSSYTTSSNDYGGYTYNTQGMRPLNMSYTLSEVFKTSGYTATTKLYYSVNLSTDKKLLVQYQYLPKGLDQDPNGWVDVSFCFSNSNFNGFTRKNNLGSKDFADATVHYKNKTRIGYDDFSFTPVGETVISHSEGVDRSICLHFSSSSDFSGSVFTGSPRAYGYTDDTGLSWFKFIELE